MEVTKLNKFKVHAPDLGLSNFEMELGRFNLLIGPSFTGKTTILRVLGFLVDILRWSPEYRKANTDLFSPFELRYLTREFDVESAALEMQLDTGETVTWGVSFRYSNDEVRVSDEYIRTGNLEIHPYAQYSGTGSRIYGSAWESGAVQKRWPETMAAIRWAESFRDSVLVDWVKDMDPETEGWIRLILFAAVPGSEFSLDKDRGWRITPEVGAWDAGVGVRSIVQVLSTCRRPRTLFIQDMADSGFDGDLCFASVSALAPEDVDDSLLCQFLGSAHNPQYINLLPDHVLSGVHLTYKDKENWIRTTPFFELPSAKEKLTVMGPGEVYTDTDLRGLVSQLQRGEALV